MTNIDKIKINGTIYPIGGTGGGGSGDPYTLTEADKTEIVTRMLNHIGGVGYLFENKSLTDIPNSLLPAPSPGRSYTLFGAYPMPGAMVELATATCSSDGSLYLNGADGAFYVVYNPDMGWQFHPRESTIKDGMVSIRANGGGSTFLDALAESVAAILDTRQ